MTTVHKSALVPYSARAMYDLVMDIESYPDFLPWCGGARVSARDGDTVIAAIDIAYGGVHKTFITRNRGVPGVEMAMRLVEGPFKHLNGHWQFQSLEEQACKVSLNLEFEFTNMLLGLVVGPVFNAIANGLVDGFHRRAEALYGKR